MFVKKQFGYDDIYFRACSVDQIFVKKSWKSHIKKCINTIFQELFSEFNYLYYFLSYAVMYCCIRKKTYCNSKNRKLLTVRTVYPCINVCKRIYISGKCNSDHPLEIREGFSRSRAKNTNPSH